jgi:catecholate siderophore receptor
MRLALIPSLLAAALVAITPATAAPDSPPGVLSGVVLDVTGAPVPGAAVVLRQPPQPPRETFTDATGQFQFENVPPAPATVSVTLSQFHPATVELTRPGPGVRVVLLPAGVREEVTVRGSVDLVTRTATATRTETALRDVPQAIAIVGAQAIAEQGMQSMADVVRHLPGVGIAQGEGNRDTPVLRGNSSTADFFVDGVRDDVQYFRDLYNVERVEALKGPNAMIFGRGGAGGLINRVTRQAGPVPVGEGTVQVGGYDNRRATADVGRSLTSAAAARVTAMYENSGSYREDVSLERYGANPTLALTAGRDTTIRLGYEHFHDRRTADRGVSSVEGAPLDVAPGTFFGNPDESDSDATVNSVTAAVDHRFARLLLRSRLRYADYDKFYQNVFPGQVNAAGTHVALSAYNNRTDRRNLFSQTDVEFPARTGSVQHHLLAGIELGWQETDNERLTGYWSSATSISVPLDNPTTSLPAAYRASATDANNHGVATTAAAYLQDQVEFTRHLGAVVGVRYEGLDVDFRDNRTNATLESSDGLAAPRAALIVKPVDEMSVYASYSMSYVPRAGEQLASLSLTNRSLEPERFVNYEVGAKWDPTPHLAATAAVYRLDRTNVAVPDPVDPTRALLVDGQRCKGVELGLTGRVIRHWSVLAAYAYQDGEITRSLSPTAQAGARLAQLPAHTVSVWNRYDLGDRLGAGVGVIHRGSIFASTDNAVTVPGFTRVDAGVFAALTRRFRAQLNVENVFDARYYASAHSNTNIMPGAPRSARVSLTALF